MRSVLYELSRIGGKREYVSPMSEEEEGEEENIPQSKQGKSILPAAYTLFVFFFSLSFLLSFLCERNQKVKIE